MIESPSLAGGIDLPHLHAIRDAEMARVLPHLPPGSRVLEVGGGTGAQARLLAQVGHDVTSVDLADSPYAGAQVFPVQPYDGHHLPFADGAFDAVFSSNVLEHVPHLPELLVEIRRVTRPGGLGLHVLPTPVWRFWSNFTHYPFVLRSVMRGRGGRAPDPATASPAAAPQPLWRRALRAALPPRHGEHGTLLSEHWLFGAGRWRAAFQSAGFTVEDSAPMGLFYTGGMLFGGTWSPAGRARAARWLGSATRLYRLRAPG